MHDKETFSLCWSEKWGRYEANAYAQATLFRLHRKCLEQGLPSKRLEMPFTSPESWRFQYEAGASQGLADLLLPESDIMLTPLFFLKPTGFLGKKDPYVLNPFFPLAQLAKLPISFFSLPLFPEARHTLFQLTGRMHAENRFSDMMHFLKNV